MFRNELLSRCTRIEIDVDQSEALLLFQAYFFPTEKVLHLLIGVVMFTIVLMSWMYEHYELVKLGVSKWYERKNRQKKNE